MARTQSPDFSGDDKPQVTSNDVASDISDSDGGTKKRKRDTTQTSEIEIDVSLPEPPSKKALRRAKREKSTKAPHPSSYQPQDGSLHHSKPDTAHLSPEDLKAGDAAPVTSTKAEPSPYSVWIGNLPFTATKAVLRTFLTSTTAHDHPPIDDATITRIHIPAPTDARSKGPLKPQNKGFAYVDLATESSFNSVVALSESPFGGRRLLIKSAKDFTGRPEPSAADSTSNTDSPAHPDAKSKKRPMKRVFIGNLGFDVTREDLQSHFAVCGGVEDVFMATFEDTGKCKGFAWVTFENIEAATDAVRGFTFITPSQDEDYDKSDTSDAENNKPQQTGKKKPKPRKWFINRLNGRTLRCEFAEDPESRYKKRFSKGSNSNSPSTARKGGKAADRTTGNTDFQQQAPIVEVDDMTAESPARPRSRSNGASTIRPGAPTDPNRRRGRSARDNKPMENLSIKYRTGGITPSTGTKITFD